MASSEQKRSSSSAWAWNPAAVRVSMKRSSSSDSGRRQLLSLSGNGAFSLWQPTYSAILFSFSEFSSYVLWLIYEICSILILFLLQLFLDITWDVMLNNLDLFYVEFGMFSYLLCEILVLFYMSEIYIYIYIPVPHFLQNFRIPYPYPCNIADSKLMMI